MTEEMRHPEHAEPDTYDGLSVDATEKELDPNYDFTSEEGDES